MLPRKTLTQFLFFCLCCLSHEIAEADVMQQRLSRVSSVFEETFHEQLSAEAALNLGLLMARTTSQSSIEFASSRFISRTLICLSTSIDMVYVGGQPFVCSDYAGQRYAGFATGAGFGAGLSVGFFALMGHLRRGTDFVGTFSGSHSSVAFGFWGGGMGIFYRNDESGLLPNFRGREKLLWLEYEAGYDFDFSAVALVIKKL